MDIAVRLSDGRTMMVADVGDHLSQAMPQSSLTMFPGEGHLLLFTHWPAIMHQLSARHLAAQQRQ